MLYSSAFFVLSPGPIAPPGVLTSFDLFLAKFVYRKAQDASPTYSGVLIAGQLRIPRRRHRA
jgi:hypothetical protein